MALRPIDDLIEHIKSPSNKYADLRLWEALKRLSDKVFRNPKKEELDTSGLTSEESRLIDLVNASNRIGGRLERRVTDGTQTIASGVVYIPLTFPFADKIYKIEIASNEIVIPEKGVYTVAAGCRWDQNLTGTAGFRVLKIFKNGTEIDSASFASIETTEDLDKEQFVSTIVFLEAGDSIGARVFQNSGVDFNIMDSHVVLWMLNRLGSDSVSGVARAIPIGSGGGGDGVAVTDFSDTFARASADLCPSKDWVVSSWSYGGAAGNQRQTEFRIGAIAGAVQGLIVNGAGVNNPNIGMNFLCFPAQVFSSIWGISQFLQVDMVTEVSASGDGVSGLVCMGGSSDITGRPNYYVLRFYNAIYELVRFSGGVSTVLVASTARPAFPLTIKLSATVNAGDITLKVYFGGVLTHTIVDNAASRLVEGTVAIYGEEVITGGTTTKHEFKNFSCGKL